MPILDQPSFYKNGVGVYDIQKVVDHCDATAEYGTGIYGASYKTRVIDDVLLFENLERLPNSCYIRGFIFDTLLLQPLLPGRLTNMGNWLNLLEHYNPYYTTQPNMPTQSYYGAINLPNTLHAYLDSLPRKYRQELTKLNSQRTTVSRRLPVKYGWSLIRDLAEEHKEYVRLSGNFKSQPYYAAFFGSDIVNPDSVVILENISEGKRVSVSLCLTLEHVLYGITDFSTLINSPITKEATLANIEWAIASGYKRYDMYNITNLTPYYYKKKFINGHIDIPVILHGDCAWAVDHDLVVDNNPVTKINNIVNLK